MKSFLLGLLLLNAQPAAAEVGVHGQSFANRGWLTGAGLTLAGAGVVALGLAAFEASQAEASARTIAAYYAHGAAPTVREAPTVRWLEERSETASAHAMALLISGVASVVAGVGLVFLDGLLAQTSVSVGIQPSGASVVLTGKF